jgi:DNA uptake protein ComE-like DNA-binding protein
MSLALVELGAGERRVRDVASYPALETFPGPELQGQVGYEVRGHEVLLQVAGVANPRGADNLSGTLSLELWAWPVDGAQGPEAGQGVIMGAAQLQPLAGGGEHSGLQCRAPFNEPPPGSYQLSLLLREWTNAHGYVTRDQRDFALTYRVAPPAAPEPVVAEVVAGVEAPESACVQPESPKPAVALAVDEPELDWEVPESVAPPPASVAVARGSRAVSLNLGSVEELARVKGLNTKLAKEIVKRRPYTSIDQLIDVRGIGKKTLDKLRALVTL